MKKFKPNSYQSANFTQHGIMRKNQRGFTQNDVEMILEWGKYSKSYNATKVFFGIKESKQLENDLKKCLQRLDKLKGSTLIVSDRDGAIITLYK